MFRLLILAFAATYFAAVLTAQPAPGSVQANGTGSISVTPDQAQLSIGVVTSAATAQEAAQQNAVQATAVIAAVKQILGTNGTVQTVGYSISPRYTNNQPAVITGYTATNTVQVTTVNLNLVGPLIDAANQAGANSVGGVVFGLHDDDPFRQQALTKAAQQALAHASAIAAGLGRKTGAVVSAQEGSTVIPYTPGLAAAGAGTPIQTGTVTVTANVTVNVALQ